MVKVVALGNGGASAVSSSHPKQFIRLSAAGQGTAEHGRGRGHGQGHERGSSSIPDGQGIILRARPIGRGLSSASNATGRGKVRRLVPDQAPGQWAFVLLLALASPGLGSLLSAPVDSCLPCKRPRPVCSRSSPPIFSPLQFPARSVRSSSPSATSQPFDPSRAVLLCARGRIVPIVGRYQIPNPVRARPGCLAALACLNSQTQQKVPAFIPSAT